MILDFLGEENSSVSAYWNDNHALSASIQTDSELYFVEVSSACDGSSSTVLSVYGEFVLLNTNAFTVYNAEFKVAHHQKILLSAILDLIIVIMSFLLN